MPNEALYLGGENGKIKSTENVLYVPDIKCNLLFVECISDQGYSLEFIQNICTIYDITTKQILGKVERIGKIDLYRLQAESVSNEMICSLEENRTIARHYCGIAD